MDFSLLDRSVRAMPPDRAASWGRVFCRLGVARAEHGAPELGAVLASVGLVMLDHGEGRPPGAYHNVRAAVHSLPLGGVEDWGRYLCRLGMRREAAGVEAAEVITAIGHLLLDHAADHRVIAHRVDSEFEIGALLDEEVDL